MLRHDPVQWNARWSVEKFDEEAVRAAGFDPDNVSGDELVAAGVAPSEVVEREGNLLVYGGASVLWECLIGNGTATAGQPLTFFDAANANIGVGDSTQAAAATDTDLVGTNKIRKGMDTGYPSHTDGVTAGAEQVTFRATFQGSEANFAWNEWGVFNAATGGRMLNRKVESLGTKASGSVWTLTVTLSLS